MRKQRNAEPRLFRSRKRRLFWAPRVTLAGKESRLKDAGANDWYAVVDEIGEGVVRLEIAAWPDLDQGGHLRFDKVYEQSYPVEALQRIVNRARAKHRQPAPDRPLRIGDAFRIKTGVRPGRSLVGGRFRGTIHDISDAARQQAKIAMYGAVARRVKPVEARTRQQAVQQFGRFQRTDHGGWSVRSASVRPSAIEPEE